MWQGTSLLKSVFSTLYIHLLTARLHLEVPDLRQNQTKLNSSSSPNLRLSSASGPCESPSSLPVHSPGPGPGPHAWVVAMASERVCLLPDPPPNQFFTFQPKGTSDNAKTMIYILENLSRSVCFALGQRSSTFPTLFCSLFQLTP